MSDFRKSPPLVYVVGPFSAETPHETFRNVIRAQLVGAELARGGCMPVIPHSIGAPYVGIATPEFWYQGTLELMSRCDAVVAVEGWPKSKGSRSELEVAGQLDIPVFYAGTDGSISSNLRECIADYYAKRQP